MKIKDIQKQVKTLGVKFINFQFSDIFGNIKNTRKPIKGLGEALKKGVWFDGSSIEGFARIQESDSLLFPDLNTFAIIPWSSKDNREARLICDVYVPTTNGELKPFNGDPRFILKKQIEKAQKLGFTYNVGPEVEFFIFKDVDELGSPVPQDNAGYFDYTKDHGSIMRMEIARYLDQLGIAVEMDHHEVAAGQHEIDIRYDTALNMADKVLTLKYTIQAAAQKHGYFVSFMPKPIAGINGSGMHVHQSLFDEKGTNTFYNQEDKYRLSDNAYHFIAGQIKHARSLSAIVAPTVNSYKRLIPGYEAPVYICWAQINRSALLRVPRYSPGREQATRIELRCPDPSANPYLAFSVMIAAGLDGIEKKLDCPKPTEENVYHLSDKEYKGHGIKMLPSSLKEAIDELQKNKVLMEALGSHLGPKFVRAKLQEWNELRLEVTPQELKKYL